MARMTGGEALVQSLLREGVRVVFGLPGVQLYGVMAALRDEPRIRFIATRHEQATSYMADGYARAGGDFGTALVVPGPGLLNAAAGLSTAYSASSPVLMICGQIPREQIGKDIGLLHEVNDQLDAIAPVTKWRRRILEVADIPAAVREAVVPAPTRPPAAGGDRDLARDHGGRGRGRAARPASESTARPRAAADIDRAAEHAARRRAPGDLRGRRRPSLGRPRRAGRRRRVPAGRRRRVRRGQGRGERRRAISRSARRFWRESPLRGYLDAADVVLAVGSVCALVTFKPDQRIIQLDVDPEEIGRNHPETPAWWATPGPRSRRCSSGSAPPAPPRAVAQGRARGAARHGRRRSPRRSRRRRS